MREDVSHFSTGANLLKIYLTVNNWILRESGLQINASYWKTALSDFVNWKCPTATTLPSTVFISCVTRR